jgi:hypothetical protein
LFLGHFALAFAAKKADPEVSLGTYFLAAQLPDMLWPCFVLAGVEQVSIAPGDTAFTPLRFDSYPFSHSLLAVALWASVMAGLHYLSKHRARAAALIGLLVLSHWILDYVSHRPDMPLFPGPLTSPGPRSLELRPRHPCCGERPVRGRSRALPGRHPGPGSGWELWPRGPGRVSGHRLRGQRGGPTSPQRGGGGDRVSPRRRTHHHGGSVGRSAPGSDRGVVASASTAFVALPLFDPIRDAGGPVGSGPAGG